MPFDGAGTFNRVHNWQEDADNGVNIEADRADEEDNGFATGLSTCLTKNGQTLPITALPMGGFRHTGVGAGVARDDYARLDQVQDGKVNWVNGGGTADAITATYSPVLTALVDGQLCFVRATTANTTTTPTFSPNALTARTIVKFGGQALAAGDIRGVGHEMILRYDLANTRWELLNPSLSTAAPTVLLIPAASSPAQTAEGSAVWDSDDDLLTVGTGAGRKTIVDTTAIQALTGKTYNGLTITATTGTVTITNLKALSVSNTLTFAGTDGAAVAFGAGGTVVYLAKTSVFTRQQNFGTASLGSSAGSIPWDLDSKQTAGHTFTENTTLANPTNMVDGGTYVVKFQQHASSPKTLAWGSAYKWAGGVAPTISSTNGAVDILTCVSDGTNMYCSLQKAFA